MTNLRIVGPSEKPSTAAEKAVGVTYDIMEVAPDQIRAWKKPPCQRELNVNAKVKAMATQIRDDGGVVPEPITLARLGSEVYYVDGQHRLHAALLSECALLYVEIRWVHVRTLTDVDALFKRLQKKLVTMRPDDVLRASESSNIGLRKIRQACPYAGYDHIRRNEHAPMLSMTSLLRHWFAAVPETPSTSNLTPDVLEESVRADSKHDVQNLIDFTQCCYDAWGRDANNKRLWTALNMTLCAWLYQRTVSGQYTAKTTKLTKDMFRRVLLSVAADASYVEWLVDRTLRERDRMTAYSKLKQIFAKRLALEMGKKPMLPQPAWSS